MMRSPWLCALAVSCLFLSSSLELVRAQNGINAYYDSPNVEALLAEKARMYDARWAVYGHAIINRPNFFSIWRIGHEEVLSFDTKKPLLAHQVRYQLCQPHLSVEDSACMPIDDLVHHEYIQFAGSMTQHGPYKHRHVARVNLHDHIATFDFPEKARFFIKVLFAETREDLLVTEPFLLFNYAAPMDKAKAQVQFERTRFTRLGKGGFGEVFRGNLRDRYHTPVAIKVIQIGSAEEWWEVQNEIHALRSLQHPNILSLLLEWEERDRSSLMYEWFLVSELASGGDLETAMSDPHIHAWMRKRGHFQHVMKQIVQGLEYMHQKGFIHRDIKPSNILVMTANYDEGSSHPPKVKIADLGLTCYASGKCKRWRNMFCGTRYYMAPEMMAARKSGLLQEVTAKTAVADNMLVGMQSMPATPIAPACHMILPPNELVERPGGKFFKVHYGNSVDMWALGAIAFRFMSGTDEEGNLANDLRTIRRGNADGLSPADRMTLDFLSSLLIRDSHLRMTAQEAAKHPYLHPHGGMLWPWQLAKSHAHEEHHKQGEAKIKQMTLEDLAALAEGEPMLIDEDITELTGEVKPQSQNDPLLLAVQHDAEARDFTAHKKKRASALKKMNRSRYLMARLLHRKQRSAMEIRKQNVQKIATPVQPHIPFWQLRKHYQQLQAEHLRHQKQQKPQQPLPSEAFRKPKQIKVSPKQKSLEKDRLGHMETFGRAFDSLRLSEL